MPRITQSLAMGVGTAGAMVDVSTYVDLDIGVQRSWGRSSEFDDVPPGSFSFTLDNADGRFTPGNTASALVTTVTEGMSVCWQLGTRLVAGTIRLIQPEFPGGESAWAKVRITCDDALGAIGRQYLDSAPDSLIAGATTYLHYTFEDFDGEDILEAGSGPRMRPTHDASPAWTSNNESPGVSVRGGTQLEVTGDSTGRIFYPGKTSDAFTTIPYAAGSVGCWGVWMTSVNSTVNVDISCAAMAIAGQFLTFRLKANDNTAVRLYIPGGSITGTVFPQVNQPVFMAARLTMSGTLLTVEFFADGVLQGTGTYNYGSTFTNAQKTPTSIRLEVGNGSDPLPSARFSHLSHTAALVSEAAFGVTTESERALALEIISGADFSISADLSTAPIGEQLAGRDSTLDLLNDLVRTEQGAIYTTTTGTLTAPVQQIVVRARTRPSAVSYSFDANREIEGAPLFVRDITNMASTVTASGPLLSASAVDATLIPRAGTVNLTESILNSKYNDLLGWAQDRSQRGANTQLKLATVTVNAMTTPTDRSSALLALIPGDRFQFTNLPSTQLGFSTWDGWLLGVDEMHTLDGHTFEMHFQPVLPATAIYDTNRYMANSALTLSAAIATNFDTTMSVSTTGPKLETTDVPYTLLVDLEQVTVTACTSATPQVATITRGVNGTTAATHTTSATIELATPSLYAF